MVWIRRNDREIEPGLAKVQEQRPQTLRPSQVWINPDTGVNEVWTGSEWNQQSVNAMGLTADWTIPTNSITLTAGTLTAEHIISTDDMYIADDLRINGTLFFGGDNPVNMANADTGGTRNIFLGVNAGNSNSGDDNVFIGYRTGSGNATNDKTIAIGYEASFYGSQLDGISIGTYAGFWGGNRNCIAIGTYTLSSSGTKTNSVAVGYLALQAAKNSSNTAIGAYAIRNVSSGHSNVAIGSEAGRYQANGSTALSTSSSSVYIGASVKGLNNSDNNSIVIGYNAIGIGANSVVLGNTSITKTALRGDVGIGIEAPTAELHVDQSSDSGAQPVLRLDQGDVDDTFIDFIGTSAADGTRSISSDTTEDSTKFGAIRVEINGVTKWIRIYDDES